MMTDEIKYADLPETQTPARELKDYRKKEKKSVKKGKKSPTIDIPMLFLTLVILTIGVIMVLSASYVRAIYKSLSPTNYFVRQLLFSVSGVGLMLLTSRIPVELYRRYSRQLMAISVFLLLLVAVVGTKVNGARRWINLGFTTFQPSEITKLSVIIMFSAMICKYKEKMATFRYGVLPFGIMLAVIVGLLALEPHLSAIIIILAVGAVLMFVGGTKLRWFALGGAFVVGGGYLAITKFAYARARIETWLDPYSDKLNNGWQTIQSLYSIGSGGLTGLGIGQGRQKYLYLPEEHNDFIFSVVCEELGFVGAILILLLFALLIIRGYWLAMHAKDRFSSLLVVGITTLLALQVFLNVAVVTNLVPCTGISLPFFSYGGTALWFQLIEIGIILSVSRKIPIKESDKAEASADEEKADESADSEDEE